MADDEFGRAVDRLVARQLEPMHAAVQRHIDRRYGSPGGPLPGSGLTLERVVDEVVATRPPDGTWPTQAAVAATLGYSVRRVQQFGPWRYILDLAAERSDAS